MKNNLNIDNLRLLLHKYYEGETSPDEEKLIECFFAETDADLNSQNMALDKELFSSMAELCPGPDDCDIPDHLADRITAITESSEDLFSSKNKKKWKISISYAAVAACICVAVTIGIRWLSAPITEPTHNMNHLAATPAKSHTLLNEENSKHNVMPEKPVAELNPPAPEPRQVKANIENVTDQNNINENYVEITDPEEAEKIVLEIGRLLAVNSQKTNEAIQNLEKTIGEYKELTKSILK